MRCANQTGHAGIQRFQVGGRGLTVSSYTGALRGTSSPASPLAVALQAPTYDFSTASGNAAPLPVLATPGTLESRGFPAAT
eukprot:4987774-Pleurochrysis_carterae.AAC.1